MNYSPLMMVTIGAAIMGAAGMVTGALVLSSVKVTLLGTLVVLVAIVLAIAEVWWLGRPRR